jgi:GNAT superfamily N-acetyltransferase
MVLRIECLPELNAADRAAIVAPLDVFSRGRGYAWQPAPIVLALRTDAGGIAGGLIGEVGWGWLRIDILAVAEEFRGRGWGRKLVGEAERMALSSGCHSSWVDTYSFRSPGFYLRLGYRVFGELPDYPEGQTRYFLTRRLAPVLGQPAAESSAATGRPRD